MEKTCDVCYEMRQPHISTCEKCGKKTMVSMVKGISAVSKCSNCGWGCASAGGYPPFCHEDDGLYFLRIKRPDDKKMMIKLANALSLSVLELRDEFQDEIIERKYRILECIARFNLFRGLGIDCEIDPTILKKYKIMMNCEYVGEYDIRTGAILYDYSASRKQ